MTQQFNTLESLRFALMGAEVGLANLKSYQFSHIKPSPEEYAQASQALGKVRKSLETLRSNQNELTSAFTTVEDDLSGKFEGQGEERPGKTPEPVEEPSTQRLTPVGQWIKADPGNYPTIRWAGWYVPNIGDFLYRRPVEYSQIESSEDALYDKFREWVKLRGNAFPDDPIGEWIAFKKETEL